MGENRRIEWIDMARGILFIFVIICHSRLAPFWLKYIYEPFFLTGFFFLSGYLYKEKSYIEKFKSIFNGLLIPFLFYSIIGGAISLAQSKQLMIALRSISENLYGGDMIWFIPCLILVEISYVFLKFLFRKNGNIFILVISMLGFWATTNFGFSHGFWCWETALFGLCFYAFGDICKKFISKTVTGRRDITVSIALIFIYIVLCLVLGCLGLLNNIDIHLNHYEHRIVFLCIASIGCYSFIRYVRLLPICSWLEEFGKYTLFLFPFHGLILRNVIKQTSNIGLTSNYFQLILSLTFTIFICLFLARYIYKYVPALGGKKQWWK